MMAFGTFELDSMKFWQNFSKGVKVVVGSCEIGFEIENIVFVNYYPMVEISSPISMTA